MPTEFDEGDETHPPQAEVIPPEAYLLVEALDWVRSLATNQNTVRLAFLVQMTVNVPGELRKRYRSTAAQLFSLEEEEEEEERPATAREQFWVGTVRYYRQIRPELERIASRPLTEQRALFNLVVRGTATMGALAPSLTRYASQIDGIAAWVIAGR